MQPCWPIRIHKVANLGNMVQYDSVKNGAADLLTAHIYLHHSLGLSRKKLTIFVFVCLDEDCETFFCLKKNEVSSMHHGDSVMNAITKCLGVAVS